MTERSEIIKKVVELDERLDAETRRLDAIEVLGFSVWQEINLETNVENWFCQYGINKIAHAHTLREAIDAALKASREKA